jgi:hypothetical protein
MPTLQSAIHALAEQFADGVLQAIRSSSLEEIIGEAAPARARARGRGRPGAPPGPTKGRLRRRSTKDLAKVAESIVALVSKHREGMKGERIRAELGIPKNAWLRPLGLALQTKKLRKTGEKRATRYFAR